MHSVGPSIRRRHRQQWLGLGLGLALLAVLLAVALAAHRRTLLDEEGARLRAQAQVIERNMARQLWSTQQALAELAREWPRWQARGDIERANAWLRAMSEIHIGARTLSVFDAEGRVLASSRPELIGRAFGEREFFQTARRSNDPARLNLSPPYRTPQGGQAMNATRVLRDDQGRFAGAVTATLDPDYFGLLLESVNYAPDVWSGVAHATGPIVTMRPARPEAEGRDLNQPGSNFARHLASGQAQTLMHVPLAVLGDPGLLVQQTVRPLDTPVDHPLVAAISRTEAGVLAGWWPLAGGVAALTGLMAVAAVFGLRRAQRAERATAEGLDRFDRISQTAPGVICQFRLTPDGRASLPFATRSLQAFFGVPVSAEPGSADALFGHIDPAQVGQVRDEILASARTLTPYHGEFRIRVPGEPERWLDVHSVPQREPDGSTLWTGLVMDSTAQHAAREAQVGLQAAQRASHAKSEFLSRASHELRTPLNAVIGFSSLMLSHPDDRLSLSQREQLNYIHDAGQHLLALINELLDVSAIESGRVQAVIDDVPLATLVGEVLSTVHGEADAAGVALNSRLLAPRLVARADRLRLKQVLLNLLSNAIKYNHRGGTVTLTLDGAPGQGVQIEVHDTGSGLSGEQRAHLFEPFNRLGADGRGIAGTGIGLTIAKMLVELMHGRIDVHSAPGQGSRFVVHLLAAAQLLPAPGEGGAAGTAAALQPMQPAQSTEADGAGLSVLYVEDNAMNASFVQRLLALRPQVRLRVAGSGAEALQAVAFERPGLMLVDLHLGDMSGFELLARLQADPATAGIRCAALTADAMPAIRERAAQAGFFDFVSKPVDIHQLLHLIDTEALRPRG